MNRVMELRSVLEKVFRYSLVYNDSYNYQAYNSSVPPKRCL